MFIQQKLIISLALILLAIPASADSLAYIESSNQIGGLFGTLDLSTGVYQQIGPGLADLATGLVPQANGSLLTLTFSGNLDSINPATGLETLVGATGLGDCSGPVSPCGPNSANAFGGLNGKLYATDFAGNLYSVNPANGHATLIGPTGLPAVTPISMNADGTLNVFDENLFDSGGKLYANIDKLKIDPNTGNAVAVTLPDTLYQINTTTGLATLVAPTLTPLNAFVNVNGAEYGFDQEDGNEILSVNLTNGNAAVVSNYDPVAGLISGGVAVPEPVPVALAAIGIAAILISRKRRIK